MPRNVGDIVKAMLADQAVRIAELTVEVERLREENAQLSQQLESVPPMPAWEDPNSR
jgi:FtsZ-binding cell division protein ZapB